MTTRISSPAPSRPVPDGRRDEVLPSVLMVWRWTGAFGIAAGLLLVAAMPLYVVRGTPPPLGDAAAFSAYVTRNNANFLTGVLVDTLYVACFLVFLAGFRHLLRQTRSDYEWASMLVFGVGLVTAAVTLVGDTLIGAAALDTFGKADPTVVRALAEASLPAFGAIGLIMTALFLASAGYTILATGAAPRWTGWLGYAAAQPG